MVGHTAFGNSYSFWFIHSLKDFCSMMLGPTKILCSIMFHEKRKFRERLDSRHTDSLFLISFRATSVCEYTIN